MIRQTTFPMVLLVLIMTCAALEQVGDNATVTTTTENVTTSNQIAENIQGVPEPTLTVADPVIERSSHYYQHVHEPTFHGFWKKKFVWRPRWVKTWQEKKVYVAVWKRMWGPAMLNEWVPIPKPPPGWVKPGYGTFVAQKYPH